MQVVVLIPAHNEERDLSSALRSLERQTRPADRIVVVADNCSDATAAVARSFAGVEVFVTVGNSKKKAGALNQAIPFLAGCSDEDALLVMDADCVLEDRFIETALDHLHEDVGAVGGIFYAREPNGLIERLQAMEYARYAREIARDKARAKVVTGTGSMFRLAALRAVATARAEGRIPGSTEQVYDTMALTEDNELTLALKHLGYRCISPKGCIVSTDVMPTLSKLFHQRVRWQRGAIDNLRNYGVTKVTLPYIVRQVLMGATIPLQMAFWVLVAYQMMYFGGLQAHPFWTGLTLIFVAERALTVRRLGPKAMSVASLLVLEIAYDMFQQFVYVKSGFDSLRSAQQTWVTT